MYRDPRLVRICETDPDWVLYHRPWADHGAWREIYLHRNVRRGKYPKRCYWLKWNGRLAKGGDAWILLQYDPEIHAWVDGQCLAHFPCSTPGSRLEQ
jgi:hypothetical protein